MSQQDRGAYTPQTDAPLAFDARMPRGARRPLPLALIGSGAVLAALLVAVVMYYRGGVRTPEGAPPAVGQKVAQLKTPPAADAKTEDPFSNLDVYAAQNVPNKAPEAKPAFAPPPEEPQPRPAPGLTVRTVEPSAVHAVPGAKPLPAPTAVDAPKALAQAAPARPAAQAAAPSPAAAAPANDAAPTTTLAAARPAPPAALHPPPAPPAPPAVAAPVTAAATAGGAARVPIGAFSSTALADKGFQDVAAAFPGPMAGKSRRVEPLERDGKTLYRGLVTGFANRSAAQAFCDSLKAAGRTCLVRG